MLFIISCWPVALSKECTISVNGLVLFLFLCHFTVPLSLALFPSETAKTTGINFYDFCAFHAFVNKQVNGEVCEMGYEPKK